MNALFTHPRTLKLKMRVLPLCLCGLAVLAGCTAAPQRAQDITLASGESPQTSAQPASQPTSRSATRSATQSAPQTATRSGASGTGMRTTASGTQSTISTGSGATINVVTSDVASDTPTGGSGAVSGGMSAGMSAGTSTSQTSSSDRDASSGDVARPTSNLTTSNLTAPTPAGAGAIGVVPVAAPSATARPRLGRAIGVSTGSGVEADNAASTTASTTSAPSVVVKSGAQAGSLVARPLGATSLPTRVVSTARTKPGCEGADCPVIKVRRVVFNGRDRFNVFLDEALVSMAEVDTSNSQPFRTMPEFERNFWRIAKPHYEVVLESGVRRDTPDIIVVQLDSYVYTGGAHGTSTTQYINWLPKVDRLLSLETMLLPRAMPQFEAALKRQHTEWLKANPTARENPESYNKLWPFKPSDNAALLAEGLAITYDPYVIAPYSYGRPTLTIPYSELNGILRPELLPK